MGVRLRINVGVYRDPYSKRAALISKAMMAGIQQCGDHVQYVDPTNYNGNPVYDVAVFYGLKGNLPRIHADYKAAGKAAVLIDLGFWDRHYNGRINGYHKIVVNDYHPTDYPQKSQHVDDRLKKLSLNIKPIKRGGEHILVAGMSEKAAGIYNLKPNEYEQGVIEQLTHLTDRRIVYRPKPSWVNAQQLTGADYSINTSIENALENAYAVVTHHSNVAIDALVSGIPAFVVESVAKPLAKTAIEEINNPYYPTEDERYDWLKAMSYLQWHVEEIEQGLPWQHMKKENII